MDEVLAKALIELLNGLEEVIRRTREELKAYVEKEINWRVIRAEKPVSPEDRAVKWLERKLSEIRQKHSDAQYEFLRNPEGWIIGLRYYSQNSETLEDVEAVSKWALDKAGQKPSKGGGS